jgi:hypothetical protein
VLKSTVYRKSSASSQKQWPLWKRTMACVGAKRLLRFAKKKSTGACLDSLRSCKKGSAFVTPVSHLAIVYSASYVCLCSSSCLSSLVFLDFRAKTDTPSNSLKRAGLLLLLTGADVDYSRPFLFYFEHDLNVAFYSRLFRSTGRVRRPAI